MNAYFSRGYPRLICKLLYTLIYISAAVVLLQDFKKLEVWRRAHEFTLEIYRITANFPNTERYNATQQLRRCGSSVAANIAEGCGRSTNKDFLRCLYIAFGELKECESFLLLARDLGYVSQESYNKIYLSMESLSKQLCRFMQCLEKKNM